ncbi:MAG TPA: arginine deiminase-related protein [Rhodothermales bacterium]|nr:arginine deiminase-related protein [Rhodothermales bacterium]
MKADAGIYRHASEVDFQVSDLPGVRLPDAALFVRPAFFQVDYVINPHMEGRVGSVDTEAAGRQWHGVVGAYETLGFRPHVIEGRRGLPDMVFCSNQTLPAMDSDGTRHVVLSNMATDERRHEVGHFEHFFGDLGYKIHPAPDTPFEGTGDAVWHADRRLLWIGTGYRSDSSSVDAVSKMLNVKAVELRLIDANFYHLDTCLSILDAETALWVPSAFDEIGRQLIRRLIPNLIAVPIEEANSSLACNAHCPDGHHVIIQAGCDETTRLVRERGFEVIECDTGEFLKAGGSVYCMKQMCWA